MTWLGLWHSIFVIIVRLWYNHPCHHYTACQLRYTSCGAAHPACMHLQCRNRHPTPRARTRTHTLTSTIMPANQLGHQPSSGAIRMVQVAPPICAWGVHESCEEARHARLTDGIYIGRGVHMELALKEARTRWQWAVGAGFTPLCPPSPSTHTRLNTHTHTRNKANNSGQSYAWPYVHAHTHAHAIPTFWYMHTNLAHRVSHTHTAASPSQSHHVIIRKLTAVGKLILHVCSYARAHTHTVTHTHTI